MNEIIRAREALTTLTPLKMNCGKLCGGACCLPDPEEDGENGMLLFPFEEELYREPIEGFPFHLADDNTLFPGGKRLVCEGKCVRAHRPLACRIFPLRMRVEMVDGKPVVTPEPDPRAWYICPILEQGGMRAMSGEFIAAVKAAGEALVQDETTLHALLNEQRMIDETRHL